MEEKRIICWWSGGVTSAVACLLSIELYGIENCEFIMMDTKNEHEDTYRFKKDCEKLYGKEIKTISAIPELYENIQEIWYKFKSLNVNSGAVCSSELKRQVRKRWQKNNKYDHQIFGFDFSKREFNRALSMVKNYPESNPIFPLLMYGYNKEKCAEILDELQIELPETYKLGFHNNNCFKTGCVQGGVGYWQKMQKEFPDKFDKMAQVEHDLTDAKGIPVTMLKDQSNVAKDIVKATGCKTKQFVFLKKHPDYPLQKSINEMPHCKIEPLFECNGFCGINDLVESTETYKQINFEF